MGKGGRLSFIHHMNNVKVLQLYFQLMQMPLTVCVCVCGGGGGGGGGGGSTPLAAIADWIDID